MNTYKVHQDLVGLSYHEIVDHLKIEEDGGDCCGYADWEVTDLPSDVGPDSLILKDCVQIDYPTQGYGTGARSVLNFIFTCKGKGEAILGYDLTAGSGSGWSYGAYVKLSLGDKELLEVSW